MTADGQPTVRVVWLDEGVYLGDPPTVHRADELDDYQEIPAVLMDAYEAADKARDAAVEAIGAYIRDNNPPKIDPLEEKQ